MEKQRRSTPAGKMPRRLRKFRHYEDLPRDIRRNCIHIIIIDRRSSERILPIQATLSNCLVLDYCFHLEESCVALLS
jgi:hypothetical protein